MRTVSYTRFFSATFFLLCILCTPPTSKATNIKEHNAPIVLQTMGSIMFGGTVTTRPNGETFHGDHGYAQYAIPQRSRSTPLIMWHGIGQKEVLATDIKSGIFTACVYL